MKNQLKKDIRHLGKLLGKVIAEQEGDEVYRQVEAARALSFDIARGTSDISALVDLFRNNTTRDFLPIARAFNHFALSKTSTTTPTTLLTGKPACLPPTPPWKPPPRNSPPPRPKSAPTT